MLAYDVGPMIERVGGGRSAHGVDADLEAELRNIPHQLVDHVGAKLAVDHSAFDRATQR